ncbi:MAG: TIGR03915 family putative DNA repair protein [Bacteroidales bacterium]|nr:TIGR03915 family putative DNA repair protein [Bacteroidales bacterium]
MNIFLYDASFEGFLTVVFESYRLKIVPDTIVEEAEVLPLFSDNVLHISADEQKAQRVWKGLKKKLSPAACSMISVVFLADDPSIPMLLFRYIRKAIDAPKSIETNFGDSDVLEAAKWYKKVGREAERVRQFVRFQKTEDDIFFAPVAPLHNVLPLAVEHFADRFSDQKWLVYDTRRKYGFFYDLQTTVEVTFDHLQINPRIGKINPDMMAEDESLFQQMWKAYFKSMTIKERINPKLHRQNMPRRFWRYLTEKH